MPRQLTLQRPRAGLLAALLSCLLLAGACSSSKTPAVTMKLNSSDSRRVIIASINSVSTSTGPLVVGEVKNQSSSPLGGVQVTVGLADRSGSSIGQQAGPTLLAVVPAGAKASFSIPFTGDKGVVATVSATVQADPAVSLERTPLTIASKASQVAGNSYEVSGTVTNSSPVTATFANTVATFYDSAGHVVGAAHDVSDATLAPGASAPFHIILLEVARLVSTYTLEAEGQSVTPGH